MADKPADVDPDEFSPDSDLTTVDAVQHVLAEVDAAAAPVTPIADVTDKHRLYRSADFQAGLELGRAQGRKMGYDEGRADIRAEDLEAGRADMLEAFRRALIASGTDPTIAFLETQKLREWARLNPKGG